MDSATLEKAVALVLKELVKLNSFQKARKGSFFVELRDEEMVEACINDCLWDMGLSVGKNVKTQNSLMKKVFSELIKRGALVEVVSGSWGPVFLAQKLNEAPDKFQKRIDAIHKKVQRANSDVDFAAISILKYSMSVSGRQAAVITNIEDTCKIWGITNFSGQQILTALEAAGWVKFSNYHAAGEKPLLVVEQREEDETYEEFSKRVKLELVSQQKRTRKALVTKLTDSSPQRNKLNQLKKYADSLSEGPAKVQAVKEYTSYKQKEFKNLKKEVYKFLDNSEVQSL